MFYSSRVLAVFTIVKETLLILYFFEMSVQKFFSSFKSIKVEIVNLFAQWEKLKT